MFVLRNSRIKRHSVHFSNPIITCFLKQEAAVWCEKVASLRVTLQPGLKRSFRGFKAAEKVLYEGVLSGRAINSIPPNVFVFNYSLHKILKGKTYRQKVRGCHGIKSSTVKHQKDLWSEPSQLAVLWSEQQPSMNPTRPAFRRKLAGEEEQASKQIINTESINRAHCTLVALLSLTENIIVSRAVIQSCYLLCYKPIKGPQKQS